MCSTEPSQVTSILLVTNLEGLSTLPQLKGKVRTMKTKEQVELMLLQCRLAEALERESAYNETPEAWCDALRWVLGRDPKDYSFESSVARRTKDYRCEE